MAADPNYRSVPSGGVQGRSHRTEAAYDELFSGSEITPEAVQFGKAMHRLKQLLGRTPDAAEVFRAAKAMGYRRQAG